MLGLVSGFSIKNPTALKRTLLRKTFRYIVVIVIFFFTKFYSFITIKGIILFVYKQ